MSVFLWQMSVTSIGYLGILFGIGFTQSLFFMIGSVIALLNVGLYVGLFYRLRAKKSVAWYMLIIVFKYAILGIVFHRLSQFGTDSFIWIAVGISTLLPTSVLATLIKVED
ncbi:MAG: hypothetical protein KDD25_05205 [Bdellovibrionales bacterium]|nr:hypothetical protein [Bdellovibrionales bacterium]